MGAFKRLILSCVLGLLLINGQAQVLTQSQVDRVGESVVKIYARHDSEKAATGFVYRDGATVVTALHVVAGANRIQVKKSNGGRLINASIEKVLKDQDLALLRLEQNTNLPALRARNSPLDRGDRIVCLGYPFNIPSYDETELTVRSKDKRLRDIIPPRVKNELDNLGYPNTNDPIISLEGHLLPGHSGAPVFDSQGEVVAISNGGLAVGGASRSWALSASHLSQLLRSNEPVPNRSVVSSQLFAEELSPTARTEVLTNSGGQRMVLIRVANYAEMFYTTDNPLALTNLAASFAGIDFLQVRYKIYRDVQTGATLVVPGEMEAPRYVDDSWRVTSSDGLIDMYYRLDAVSSNYDAQQKSVRFEASIAAGDDQPLWRMDPNFSYPFVQPTLDGMLVRRLGYVKYQQQNFNWVQTKQAIITFSGKGTVLLSAATKLNNQNALYDPQSRYRWFVGASSAFLTTLAN